jgi:hypothetical protein
MKNIIILLLCCFSLSICAQNSVKTTPKKPKKATKATKKATPIHVKEYSDIQFIASKSVVSEPDTPILRINLLTGDGAIYKGDSLIYIFRKQCEFGCFQMIPQPRDTLSSEKFAQSAFLLEAKYRGLVFNKDGYSDFRKANLELEPNVIRYRKVIEDALKGIDEEKEKARKVKQ